jgi:hypothetical protein
MILLLVAMIILANSTQDILVEALPKAPSATAAPIPP